MSGARLGVVALCAYACACSSGSGGSTAGGDAGPSVDATMDAGPTAAATMQLLELRGKLSSGAATVLDGRVSFHEHAAHDYDDRAASGCVADHFVASSHPMPKDGDAGTLRITGYAGGTLTDGHPAAQPIVGFLAPTGLYQCIFPAGDGVVMAPFAASASPLGAGPISYATAAGASFGAVLVDATPPAGTVAVQEDLGALKLTPGSAMTLHVSCSGGCGAGPLAVRIAATSSTDTTAAWPYGRLGLVDCEVPAGATTVTVPGAAVAAMLASDGALDTITTSVATLGATVDGKDDQGNVLRAATGRGVFGVSR